MKSSRKMTALFAAAAAFFMTLIPACAAPGNSKNITLNAKKILVVYYSATGTTELLAKIIAKESGADILFLL